MYARQGEDLPCIPRLDEIDGWDEDKAMLWQLLTELPTDGGQQLPRLEPRVRGEPKLRRLVAELCQKWRSLLGHRRVAGIRRGLGLTPWVWSGRNRLS